MSGNRILTKKEWDQYCYDLYLVNFAPFFMYWGA